MFSATIEINSHVRFKNTEKKVIRA